MASSLLILPESMSRGAMVPVVRPDVILRHGHVSWTTGLTIPMAAKRMPQTWLLFASITTT